MENILWRKGRKIRRGKEGRQKNYVCKEGKRVGKEMRKQQSSESIPGIVKGGEMILPKK